MMEVEAPVLAADPSASRTPESLRQRQRDRLSPRGRAGKSSKIATAVREMEGTQTGGITLWPAPRSKTTGRKSPDLTRKKQLQEGLRKENSVNRRARREAEDRKLHDIVPDGGSAGREGRQFTVANVGNNGRIYLRPTIRPANQRYPQPPFVFPITPPSTAGLDTLVTHHESDETPRDSIWTPSRSPSTPTAPPRDQYFSTMRTSTSTPTHPPRHKRAHSYSTIDEQHAPIRDSDVGAYRVVIERPGAPKIPEPFIGLPTLQVPIPSYKLGTPRFSVRGTAFLRGSYTTTDDMRSSIFSHKASLHSDPNSRRPTRVLSRRHSDASRQLYHSVTASGPSSPFNMSAAPPGIIRQRTPIVPEMFNDLTFKPACDHPSVVRYSVGGGIRAATPARIVAEITSQTFVDYDLLSDFFLTFRSFLDTTDLLLLLIARLKWALAREDETGTVVRVRTFVAIRHWILNYFVDDYVIDYDLRKSFCDLLNNFLDDPLFERTKVPGKILGELKKCWRRVCALYWDGPEFDTELGPDIPIAPGGVAGSRDPNLDQRFWEVEAGPPQLHGIIHQDFPSGESSNTDGNKFFADVSRAGHLDSIMRPPVGTLASDVLADSQGEPPLSPTSIMSEDIVSCSFPSRARAGGAQPLGAHPVPASSIYDPAPPVAMTPKALTGKRVRPAHSHKRSGSFSDSFRDHRALEQPVQKVIYKSTELFLALPYAGSLVRGNFLPPGQALVEAVAPSTPGRDTTLFSQPKGPSAMSGPGMKKLLGTVRRALSTRTGLGPMPNSSPTQGSFPHIPPIGVRGATINRLPGTAVVPQAHRDAGLQTPVRIDLLGAEASADFEKAVREEAKAEAEHTRQASKDRSAKSDHSSEHEMGIQYSSMAPDPTDIKLPRSRPAVFSEVTSGSKSIVIVDDTITPEIPIMTGAMSMNTTSVDDFAEAYMQPSGGPTPPTTPPEPPLGTPRRSSHLLGHHTNRKRSLSMEENPSKTGRPISHLRQERASSRLPFNHHPVHAHSQSFKSKRSVSLRRYASFHSGLTRHKSERSFDATTFSESEAGTSHDIPEFPLPLRVLRRRPGGDLRAVTNVGDLNHEPVRRPMSTGSLATYSDSVRSSYLLGGRDSSAYVDVNSIDYERRSKAIPQTYSLGALAEAHPKQRVSLFSTHSSQPVMRPSFEKEAQMLANIPDDDDDDGGVESALLKLEGKFEQRRSELSNSQRTDSQSSDIDGRGDSFGARPLDVSTLALDDDDEVEEEKRRNRHEHMLDPVALQPIAYRPQQNPAVEKLEPTVYQPRGMPSYPSLMSPRSVDSYNSTPLLERGLSEHGLSRRSRNWSEQSILREPSIEMQGRNDHSPDSSHVNSFDFIQDSDSLRKIPVGQTMPHHESVQESFLESESDDRSDLSSEMSIEVISRTELTEPMSPTVAWPLMEPGTTVESSASRSHRHPPSPPITMTHALHLSPQPPHDTLQYERREHQGQSSLPPTPEFTPTGQGHAENYEVDRGATPTTDPLRSHRLEPSRKTSVHLPFTLAFDSQILAQQFTLIEKDALNEIDWKDLMEMQWKDTTHESRSWVDFLRNSDLRGVEVVIARFNIVVKWAQSEIVLTGNLEERVRTIMKFIHIAAHCRKYRNFATMTQLTVALTNKVISRLTKTWALVPQDDLRTLRQLEELVTPSSNFHNLRAEMEGAGADQGCIPFVGIYTHDLLVNSERPSQIASTPSTDPLVNFERCRVDATIVKNLLRLLEASQLYRFLPIEGITERCLWMAALSEEDMIRYGKAIQE